MPAWGATLILSSALLAALDLAPAARDCGVPCSFAVMDDVSPQAKLVFGALLGGLMWLARRRRPSALAALLVRDAAAGAIALLMTLAVLPAEWSRGFGIGIFESRFSLVPAILYLVGAASGAAIGTLLERSCRARLLDG